MCGVCCLPVVAVSDEVRSESSQDRWRCWCGCLFAVSLGTGRVAPSASWFGHQRFFNLVQCHYDDCTILITIHLRFAAILTLSGCEISRPDLGSYIYIYIWPDESICHIPLGYIGSAPQHLAICSHIRSIQSTSFAGCWLQSYKYDYSKTAAFLNDSIEPSKDTLSQYPLWHRIEMTSTHMKFLKNGSLNEK